MLVNVAAIGVGELGKPFVRLTLAHENGNLQTHALLLPEEARATAAAMIRAAEQAEHAIITASKMPPGQPGKT